MGRSGHVPETPTQRPLQVIDAARSPPINKHVRETPGLEGRSMLHRPQLTRGLGGRATEKLIFIPRIWACHAHTVAKGTELVVGASGPQARLALLLFLLRSTLRHALSKT